MTNKLRALLLSIGFVGSGVVMYVARSDVTPAELKAAGLENCPAVHVACTSLEGKTYHRRALAAYDCRDAGAGYVLKSKKVPTLMQDTCSPVSADVAPPIELPLECACRMASGDCSFPLPDGGMAPASFGLTLQPGWVGPGCQRKSCLELLGSSSWPKECPP